MLALPAALDYTVQLVAEPRPKEAVSGEKYRFRSGPPLILRPHD
jgi:hypothetical protein